MQDQEVYDFLEHFGVKGMQWGVRRDNRVESLAKIGRGEGSLKDKTKAILGPNGVTVGSIIKNKGLKEAAQKRADKLTERNYKVRSGEASVKQTLAYYGGTRFTDLIPTRTKN